MITATLVASSYGDWEGLYINGELVEQNHSIDVRDALEAVTFAECNDFDYFDVDYEWLEERLRLPARLEDIPEHVRLVTK